MFKPTNLVICLAVLLAGCSDNHSALNRDKSAGIKSTITPSKHNGGISLQDDFAALVVDEGVGKGARHLVVRDNGDIYVKLQKLNNGQGIIALRDNDGDGHIDQKLGFTDFIGTGIDIYGDYLYASSPKEVYRYALKDDDFIPSGKKELLITGFPEQHDHWSKPFTFDDRDNIYVTIGSPSNACQQTARSPGSPGIDPCPQRELQSGIWQFSATRLGQIHGRDGQVYGQGIRNAVALDWDHQQQQLHAVQHGRDQLNTLWPEYFTAEQNAQLPAEEFIAIKQGDDFGWPYCYFDQFQHKKMLAPEYGGDGKQQGRCATKANPIEAFPGHLAPNDLLFYQGEQFPERYKNGAFIAFHGSWNRAPLAQAGYKVVFVPFKDGKPSGDWEVFADGFTGGDHVYNPGDAKHRPMGLAEGPDGSLYISDSVKGKIWRVMYYGKGSYTYEKKAKAKPAPKRAPANAEDFVGEPRLVTPGEEIYNNSCLVCHQKNGLGVAGLNPPLTSAEWVGGSDEKLIGVILNGLAGATVDGENYRNIMPPHGHLSDNDISQVLTYIRASFGNGYPAISAEQVAKARKEQNK